jgi:hypothetical protein
MSPAAAAQQPGVSLAITPDSIVLSPGQENRAFVVVQNASDSTLSGLRLTSLPATGMRVWFSDSLITSIPPRATVATTVFFARDSVGTGPGAVVIRADYHKGPKGDPGVVLGTVRLVADRFETAEQAADVKLSSSARTLTAREPGKAYVIVTNKTDLPLEVRRILGRAPFVQVYDSTGGSIPPHGVATFEIDLQTRRRVQPGSHTMVFDVGLAWTSTGGTRTGNVVLTHELEVGVFGESTVLKALSVPSFLLLPGFLMVVAFSLVWQYQRFRAGANKADFPLAVASADFWVIAITLSGLMAVWYPRDYLSAYGTRDLVEVWLVSVVLGAGAGGLWFGWTYVWSTPSGKDSPITVLRKLGRQGLGIECEQVKLEDGRTMYLLQKMPQDEGAVWVGPTIAAQWQPAAAEADRKRFEVLRRDRRARPLADFLRDGEARQVIRARWKPEGAVPMRASKVAPAGKGQIIEPEG